MREERSEGLRAQKDSVMENFKDLIVSGLEWYSKLSQEEKAAVDVIIRRSETKYGRAFQLTSIANKLTDLFCK